MLLELLLRAGLYFGQSFLHGPFLFVGLVVESLLYQCALEENGDGFELISAETLIEVRVELL